MTEDLMGPMMRGEIAYVMLQEGAVQALIWQSSLEQAAGSSAVSSASSSISSSKGGKA